VDASILNSVVSIQAGLRSASARSYQAEVSGDSLARTLEISARWLASTPRAAVKGAGHRPAQLESQSMQRVVPRDDTDEPIDDACRLHNLAFATVRQQPNCLAETSMTKIQANVEAAGSILLPLDDPTSVVRHDRVSLTKMVSSVAGHE
jgi:hypothetical protein